MNTPFKAYKAFNRKKTCLGFQYEEGKTYEIKDKPILCEKGFHFCKELVLTLFYYPVNSCITENIYAEVDIIGNVVFEEPTKHKGVTNKIKILRFIPDDEVKKLVDEKNNSGNGNSCDGNSGDRNSGNSNSGNSNSGGSNSGYRNSGYSNSGDGNSGYRNSGDGNSGYRNSGDRNSGDRNSGDRNSGNSNSGDGNSGYRNSGDRNSGNSNSGDRNSGGWNSGDRNSGGWNSINKETGFFNSKNPEFIRVFNKKCSLKKWENADKPDFLYFEIDKELGYKGSFMKSWENADHEDRIKVKDLPNFDADVFFDISGIDLRENKE